MSGARRSARWTRTVQSTPIAAAFLAACALAMPALAQNLVIPGDAIVTRFSGTVEEPAPAGGTRIVIDTAGASAIGLSLASPDAPPSGTNASASFPETFRITASDTGQVFGLAIRPGDPPTIYFTATSAFGLHLAENSSDWMDGQWGEDGGPGTVYRLSAGADEEPEVFANVTLGERENSGAALGAIAYDPWNDQLFVSDLETGMIHRLATDDGRELGRYDHGVEGRADFYDAGLEESASLEPVEFDPASGAMIDDCPSGDFSRSPACWNFADFRRRVWGVGVFHDPVILETRLFYSIWGSQGFGSPDYTGAEDDQKNSVWSIRIAPDGDFDLSDIRREFFLPDFFRAPEAIARAGLSNPVTDIAFATASSGTVMLLSERGGVRNLGLAAESAFAYPHEARVLRYEFDEDGNWQPIGRYDASHYDRQDDGPPYERANASGGVSFGMGYSEDWELDPAQPDAFAWMTGDRLCSPEGPCVDAEAYDHSDEAQVDGVQGVEADSYDAVEPEAAFKPYPSPGPAYPAAGPDAAYMVDADGDLTRDDASRMGNVEVYQPGPIHIAEAAPEYEPPYEPGWDPAPPYDDDDEDDDDDDYWPEPPDDLDTDLAVYKDGPLTCQEGVDCSYTLRITNLGPLPYIGPLAFNDTMPVGATLSTASPGWNCVVLAPDVSCVTLGFAILPVGGTATLHLDILLPAPIPAGHVENCVGIDWFEMGTDDGPGDGNDYVCIDTPVAPGFNLGLAKSGAANCVENASCPFLLTITNYGPGTLNGVLAFHDTLPAGATFLSAGGGMGCVQVGAALDCQAAGVTIPTGGFVFVLMQIKLPAGIAGGTVDNCAEIDWSEMGADDGEPDPHADQDCHTVNVLPLAGYFDLTVQKSSPAHCDPGADCAYQIKLTNEGPDDYTGAVLVRDNLPAGATFTSASPGWACITLALVTSCDLAGGPHLLHPGDSKTLTLTIHLPNPIATPTVSNCTSIRFGDPGMPAADNPPPPIFFEKPDSDCVSTNITDGFDLQIAKLGPAFCFEGHLCDYQVSVTNGGPRAIAAGDVIAIKDTLPAGATVENVSVGWNCFPGGPATTHCVKNNAALASGATSTFTLSVRLPDPVIGLTVDNCAWMEWNQAYPGGPDPTYTGDDNAATNGPACVTTPVLAANLAPFGGTVCEKGAICTLDVSIDNRGGRLFRGAAGLRGNLNPAVRIDSIESLTPGLTCEVTGEGGYECNADELELKAGDKAPFRVMIDIPADFAESRIVHQKQMIWPDAEVKDTKPEDDRHVSIIVIAQAEEPPPPPPPAPICQGGEFVDGKCVCPEGTVATERGDNDFACVKPPLVCVKGAVRNNECLCPAGTEQRQTGVNAYECVELPPPACEGGRVRRGECVCPEGTELNQTGDNSFECVAPPPEITCEGGRVRRGECRCPEGTERKQTGDNAYECVAPAPPEITCEGGRVRGGECRCPEGTERKQAGDNAFECVVLPPPLVCEGGRVRGGECRCPEGTERQQTGESAFECVALPPPLVCEGGRVRGGECRCPEGTDRKQTGDNAFECVAAPPPEIICEGGRVRRGECRCPEGTERKQTSENAFECAVPPPPDVVCEGGRVRRGECRCPEGTERKQTGDNAFQCIAPQLPDLICEGGRVRRGECRCPQGTERKQISDNAFQCVAPQRPDITCEGGRVRRGQCRCPEGTERQQTGDTSFVCVKASRDDVQAPDQETPQLRVPRIQLPQQ